MKFFSTKKTTKTPVRKSATVPVNHAFRPISDDQKQEADKILRESKSEATKWELE